MLLGGVDLREIGNRELYRNVSFVFQDVRLLHMSIADNIALAVPNADRDEVVRAARAANIHERILGLPRGYESVIGDDATLSGGEAQRISIARALLADTPALVLDEATARVTEYLLAQPVLRAGGRTAEGFRALDDSSSEVQRVSRRSTWSALPGVVGSALTVQSVFTVLLALGANLALGGKIGAPDVLAILVLAARCADPLLSLAELGGSVRSARAELMRLDAVLGTAPLPEPSQPISVTGHGLAFESVGFGHDDRTVLDGFSVSVPEGRRSRSSGRRAPQRARCCT